MGHKVGLAQTCLYISAGLYVVVAVAVVPLFAWIGRQDPDMPGVFWAAMGWAMAVFSLVLAGGVVFTAVSLGKRKTWAWFVSLVLFALYLPSLYFPLGALGMWAILGGGTKREFAIKGI